MFSQVRNLCYMVTRRERTKHAICKLQEQIFHLQMKVIEQDLCRGRRLPGLLPATSRSWVLRRVYLWGLAGGHVHGARGYWPPPLPSIIQLVGQVYIVRKEPEVGT